MDLLVGRERRPLDDAEVEAALDAAAVVVVDVGTGDGRGAYRLAQQHPDWLVIGIDPAAERMADTARKAQRKPSRGGCPNVWFCVASAEAPPPILSGRAHRVDVVLPWSSLLRGVVRGDRGVLTGLCGLLRTDGELTAVVGTDIWRPPVPTDIVGLDQPRPGDPDGTLAAAYRAAGLELTGVSPAGADELARSTWARRLAAPGERFVLITARRAAPAAGAVG